MFCHRRFDNTINFMGKEETQGMFRRDRDNYVGNMTKYDLVARRVATASEYIQKSVDAVGVFTSYERQTIKRCVLNANTFFNELEIDVPGFEPGNVAAIPWNFAKTKGNAYEMGFPHTRADIIFVSSSIFNNDDRNITSTIIHEKVHVYQRMYPHMMELYAKHIQCTSKKPVGTYPLARANPDLDRFIYNCSSRDWVFQYKTTNPTSITDVDQHEHTMEHPNEHMAYYIASLYMLSHDGVDPRQ